MTQIEASSFYSLPGEVSLPLFRVQTNDLVSQHVVNV